MSNISPADLRSFFPCFDLSFTSRYPFVHHGSVFISNIMMILNVEFKLMFMVMVPYDSKKHTIFNLKKYIYFIFAVYGFGKLLKYI